jgi:FkbM family methyltransferase
MGVVRDALKRARYSQPANRWLTGAARAVLGGAGVRSEFVIRHLHRCGAVESRLPNGARLRLWSAADDWVSNQVFWRGWLGYEPETSPLFFRLARHAAVTLDVGAYVGFFSLLAGHANPRARVYAFEPLSAAFERLRQNIARNALSNVEAIAAAVADAAGQLDFFHAPANTGIPCSSSLSYEFMAGTAGLRKTTVPVLRLDDFVREKGLERVDLVKIDTESTEPAVLAGGRGTLGRDHPNIVCEVLRGRGAEPRLEHVLAPLGYRYYLLTPDGPALRERIEGHPEWLNYLFSTLPAGEVARL